MDCGSQSGSRRWQCSVGTVYRRLLQQYQYQYQYLRQYHIVYQASSFCNSEFKSHLFTPQSHKTTTVSSSLPQVLDIDPGKGFYLQSGGDLLITFPGVFPPLLTPCPSQRPVLHDSQAAQLCLVNITGKLFTQTTIKRPANY